MSNEPFTPTHAAPPGGMQTWANPDPASAPDNQLGGGLPVQLIEEAVGWGHVRCSNGWETWVDARLLVALSAPASQPAAPAPPYAPIPAPAPVTVETPAPAPAPAPVPAPAPAPPAAPVAPAPAPPSPPVAPAPAPVPAPAPAPAPAPPVPAPVEPAPPPAPRDEFHPTHRAPATGLGTRERPDPGRRPNNRIEAGLELQLIERADAWARVRCSNGWETWVDGRYLVDI